MQALDLSRCSVQFLLPLSSVLSLRECASARSPAMDGLDFPRRLMALLPLAPRCAPAMDGLDFPRRLLALLPLAPRCAPAMDGLNFPRRLMALTLLCLEILTCLPPTYTGLDFGR